MLVAGSRPVGLWSMVVPVGISSSVISLMWPAVLIMRRNCLVLVSIWWGQPLSNMVMLSKKPTGCRKFATQNYGFAKAIRSLRQVLIWLVCVRGRIKMATIIWLPVQKYGLPVLKWRIGSSAWCALITMCNNKRGLALCCLIFLPPA